MLEYIVLIENTRWLVVFSNCYMFFVISFVKKEMLKLD